MKTTSIIQSLQIQLLTIGLLLPSLNLTITLQTGNGLSFQMLCGEYGLVKTKNPMYVGLDAVIRLIFYSESQFIIPVIVGRSQNVRGRSPLGTSATGTPRKSSFIINPITNQTTTGAHKTTANRA